MRTIKNRLCFEPQGRTRKLSVEMNARVIASGFEADCKELIVRFEKESCIRFETFGKIWKDMHFSLIFA